MPQPKHTLNSRNILLFCTKRSPEVGDFQVGLFQQLQAITKDLGHPFPLAPPGLALFSHWCPHGCKMPAAVSGMLSPPPNVQQQCVTLFVTGFFPQEMSTFPRRHLPASFPLSLATEAMGPKAVAYQEWFIVTRTTLLLSRWAYSNRAPRLTKHNWLTLPRPLPHHRHD